MLFGKIMPSSPVDPGPWRKEDVDWLVSRICGGVTNFSVFVEDASAHLGRSQKSVRKKLAKIGFARARPKPKSRGLGSPG